MLTGECKVHRVLFRLDANTLYCPAGGHRTYLCPRCLERNGSLCVVEGDGELCSDCSRDTANDPVSATAMGSTTEGPRAVTGQETDAQVERHFRSPPPDARRRPIKEPSAATSRSPQGAERLRRPTAVVGLIVGGIALALLVGLWLPRAQRQAPEGAPEQKVLANVIVSVTPSARVYLDSDCPTGGCRLADRHEFLGIEARTYVLSAECDDWVSERRPISVRPGETLNEEVQLRATP